MDEVEQRSIPKPDPKLQIPSASEEMDSSRCSGEEEEEEDDEDVVRSSPTSEPPPVPSSRSASSSGSSATSFEVIETKKRKEKEEEEEEEEEEEVVVAESEEWEVGCSLLDGGGKESAALPVEAEVIVSARVEAETLSDDEEDDKAVVEEVKEIGNPSDLDET